MLELYCVMGRAGPWPSHSQILLIAETPEQDPFMISKWIFKAEITENSKMSSLKHRCYSYKIHFEKDRNQTECITNLEFFLLNCLFYEPLQWFPVLIILYSYGHLYLYFMGSTGPRYNGKGSSQSIHFCFSLLTVGARWAPPGVSAESSSQAP